MLEETKTSIRMMRRDRMIWWDDEKNKYGAYDGVLYRLLRVMTCVLWHKHPSQVKGSWYSCAFVIRGYRCRRCGAWLKKEASVYRQEAH